MISIICTADRVSLANLQVTKSKKGRTNISLRAHKQRVLSQGLAAIRVLGLLAQDVAYAQGLEERAVVEDPPDGGLALDDGVEEEEGVDGVVGGLERAADVDGDVGAAAGVEEHEVVEVVAVEEESLG